LRDKAAQVWMSSRPVKDTELKEFKSVDLLAGDSEHVIALDGLAVIVNKGNPVGALSIDEIADIFSGKVTDWQNVKDSGRTGSIKIFRRDDNSGTASTFKDLILEKRKWAPQAVALADSRKLESEVAGDAGAIGFLGVGYVANTKALAIKTKCGMAFKPDPFSIKTEEYPLSRRLFLYTSGQPANVLAQQIVEFAGSSEGQKSVREMNFVDLVMDANGREFDQQGGRLANMLIVGAKDEVGTRNFINEVRFARRISTTLRFKPNSTTPDNKSVRDIEQLADAMKSGNFGASNDFILIGFADDTEEKAGKAIDLGLERASMVGKLLQDKLDAHPNKALQKKVYKDNIKSFGAAAPAVCNTDDRGRSLNRRVEVWLK
jgi:phosphate transport system substrate-binding protein